MNDIQGGELRASMRFDALAETYLRQYPSSFLAEFSGMQQTHIEKIVSGEIAGSSQELFGLQWCMELILAERAVTRLQNLQGYLEEWNQLALTITELDEGILEDKDIEQLHVMHHHLHKELHGKIKMLQHLTSE